MNCILKCEGYINLSNQQLHNEDRQILKTELYIEHQGIHVYTEVWQCYFKITLAGP